MTSTDSDRVIIDMPQPPRLPRLLPSRASVIVAACLAALMLSIGFSVWMTWSSTESAPVCSPELSPTESSFCNKLVAAIKQGIDGTNRTLDAAGPNVDRVMLGEVITDAMVDPTFDDAGFLRAITPFVPDPAVRSAVVKKFHDEHYDYRDMLRISTEAWRMVQNGGPGPNLPVQLSPAFSVKVGCTVSGDNATGLLTTTRVDQIVRERLLGAGSAGSRIAPWCDDLQPLIHQPAPAPVPN